MVSHVWLQCCKSNDGAQPMGSPIYENHRDGLTCVTACESSGGIGGRILIGIVALFLSARHNPELRAYDSIRGRCAKKITTYAAP